MRRFGIGCFSGLALVLGIIGLAVVVVNTAEQVQIFTVRNNDGLVPVAQRTRLDSLAQQAATPTLVPMEQLENIRAEDQILINLYQRVTPSVVNIEITQRTSFFEGVASSGSGFVFSEAGHIVTNAHVVQDAVEILVTFSDGYVTTAEIVGIDEYSDLAVIRVDVVGDRLVPVTLGNSNELLVGQRVVAIGNPFGLQSSMTAGIISALGRALPSARLINQANQRFNNPSIIQVDAAVNPGNSGGLLLNYEGEVVGVNTAIRTETGTFQGVAFAVPVNTLASIAPQLIENGVAEYSWLGVSTFPDESGFTVAALAEELDLPIDYGVMIEDVSGGSPADEAGLRGGDDTVRVRGVDLIVGGDIIVAIDGVIVRDLDELLAYLVENTQPGDVSTLTVYRGDETLDLDVELGVRP
ncbi:MAG: S1C family serine protease [Anaerolineales bacterium]